MATPPQISPAAATVLAVGSVAFDSITTPRGRAERVLGGAATYFALAARHFAPVRIVAVVGDDFLPAHEQLLASRGICLRGLQRRSGKCFFWAGEYEANPNLRRTLATELNVFADFQPELPQEYLSSPVLFLGNIAPELQTSVCRALPAARLVGGDTMNYWIQSQPEAVRAFLRHLDLLMINDSEAVELSGEWNLALAARKIRAMGPKQVIIKRGEHGASLYAPEGCCSISGYPLEDVRDPTGAGDSFAGGVIGYLASQPQGDPGALRRALVYGSVMGSFACERFGVERLLDLTREEVDTRYREFLELSRIPDAV